MGRLPHAYLVFYFSQKEVRYVNESIINDNTTHDPEDYEAIHDHLADEDDIYNESYIISKKNYEINMDKWKPGTPLWITGSSGDGKSTYANQLAKEKKAFLVPLDLFLVRIAKPKEKYDKFLNDTSGTVISNGSQMILDYINKHPELPWTDPNTKGNWGARGQDSALWNGLFDWLIDASAKNPKYKNKLIIFEGCNICLMPVEKAIKFPFIIMGTSRLDSSLRRIKRDRKEHDDYSIFKIIYREFKRSTNGSIADLNKAKDNFEKGLKKQMKTINESYVIQESQQLIQRNLSKLDYDPKTQTVDSHIKDAKTGKNFRIRLIVDDNHPVFKEIWETRKSRSPAVARYAKEYAIGENKDCDKFIANSAVIAKSRLVNMRNNASVAIVNHEIGHIIDKIHLIWPERLTPEDVQKFNKLKAAAKEVLDNTDWSTLTKHDRAVEEPIADAFASDYVSTHALRQAMKTSKRGRNMEYAELKQLRKEYEKLRRKFPLEEQKKIEAEIDDLENKMSPLIAKRNELEEDDWDNTGKHDAEMDEIQKQLGPLYEKINDLRRNELRKFDKVRMKELEMQKNRKEHHTPQKSDNRNDMTKKIQAKMNQESCLIMDNDEFFMEASKNPDVKARKRTVKNLRRIGVERAHEVDNKKMIDKLERQLADLFKRYRNGEISFSDYYDAKEPLKKQIRKLEEGIDIEITDSYGKKHKTKLSSNNQSSDSYWEPHDIINITPETMKSNHFDSTFNHEAGHTEQAKRIGFDNLKQRDYTVSDKDDYIIKCAKLFLQKNVDKMNSHDNMWTELHADILSCKKSGYGKMIKDVYSFKKSKTELEKAIDDCIKHDEEYRKKIENDYISFRDENGEKQIASQKDVDECIALYEEMQAKLDHSFEILDKRYEAIEHQKFFGPLDMSKEYKTKLNKIYERVKEKRDKLYSEKNKLKRKFEHKGITAKDAENYNKCMEMHLKYFAEELADLKAGFTTYDYRIKFMEDMKHIHEGHPERCSMKYPPMTPEDKKYMEEAECILVSNEEFFGLLK